MCDKLVSIDLCMIVFDDLGNSGDGILCCIQVLNVARVGRVDDVGEQPRCACARRRELHAAELRQHAAAVRRRLAHLRLRRHQPAQHRLEEYILVFYARRS